MMELSKIDYTPIVAKVKVYDKTYKRKNKQGKETTVKTVQNIITLPKEIPFKHNEDVIILSQSAYDNILINISKNDNQNGNMLDNLEKEVQVKSELIAEYESRINELESEISNNTALMKKFNETIVNLNEDLRNANHTKDMLNANYNETLIEMATLEERLNKNKDIINILSAYYESLLNEAMNVSSKRMITEINKELASTNFIQRLKGLTITKEPNINKEEITKEALAKLNNVIHERQLLE